MAENRNKLRGTKSQAPVIYTAVICGVSGLAFIIYATYAYLGYIRLHNITDPGISDIMDAMGTLFTEDSLKLPITLEVIQEVLIMQVRDIWWVYVGIALAIFLMMTSRNPNDYRGMEHGSARWADKYDERMFTDKTGIPCGDNFYVTVENPDHKFYSSHNLNEIVIGGSGAGKSFRKIKPDIMQMTGSYVVTDPSGELYRDCAKVLRENGYKVRVLNLTNISLSNSYNPFVYMVEEQDVLNIADLFMKNSAGEGEKEDFWSGAAQDMLVMIMLYLFKADDEVKSFGRVIRLVNSIQYKDNKIDEACELGRCMKKHQMKEYVSKKLGKTTVRTDTRSHNRGNQGGGSDNESFAARDLLAPDEISRALKKGKNGKCIVFVDEYNPFFLDKFNTLKHPLIGKVGSSFKKDWVNNSDITVDFASVKEERAKRYAEVQKKAHLISGALEKGDYSQPMTFEESREEENKRKLKEMFNSSNSTMMSFNDAVILPDDDLSDIEDG